MHADMDGWSIGMEFSSSLNALWLLYIYYFFFFLFASFHSLLLSFILNAYERIQHRWERMLEGKTVNR